MEAAEEERLRTEGAAYRLQECGEAAGDPTQSKSFMKKMARIQRQKERKQRSTSRSARRRARRRWR